jgi:predicted RNase H-like HicB family nuclease
MTYRYTVLLERGASEDVWVATVPTLPGCVTQVASLEEALARAQEAAAGHIESLVALGEPVPTESEPSIIASVAIDIDPSTSASLAGAAD